MTTPTSVIPQKCVTRQGANVCLFIDPLGNGRYLVHIGIDIPMSQQDAQAIIDAHGDPFSARMRARDQFFDNDLFGVPLTKVGASAESGLSADFDREVPRSWLNEDNTPGDRRDEVFGRIKFVDPRTHTTRTFDTPTIHYYF